MKLLKLLIILALAVSGFSAFAPQHTSAAISDDAALTCWQKWQAEKIEATSKITSASKARDTKEYKSFKSSTCNVDTGGNCKAASVNVNGTNKFAWIYFSCTKPDIPPSAKQCYKLWNNVSISTPRQSDNFSDSGCSVEGLCTTNVGSKSAKITCDKDGEAVDSSDDNGSSIKDPALGACTKNKCDIIAKFVNPLIKLLTALVGVAVVAGIIIGGIEISSAAGDPKRVASGRGHIQNAIIALIAFIFLFGFLQFLIPGGIL